MMDLLDLPPVDGDLFYATTTFSVAAIGTCLHIYLLVFTTKKLSFEDAFSYFSISQIISHLALLILFLGPVTIELLWYRTTFTDSRGKWYVLIAWTFAFTQCLIYFIDGCRFYFIGINLHFTFEDSECGRIVGIIQDFAYNASLAVIAFMVDLSTLFKLLSIRRKFRKTGTAIEDDEKSKRDLKLFSQALSTAILYLIMLFNFHCGSLFFKNREVLYWMTTFVWELYLTVDGLTILIIYQELRDPITKNRLFRRNKIAQQSIDNNDIIRVNNIEL